MAVKIGPKRLVTILQLEYFIDDLYQVLLNVPNAHLKSDEPTNVIPFNPISADIFRLEIPAQAENSIIRYRIKAQYPST